jgi:hypothetical protein
MGLLERFFGKGEAKPSTSAPLVANMALKNTVSLQALFGGPLRLDAAALTKSLRAHHPSMSEGSCELDAALAKQGTPLGLVGWGSHVVKLVGFDVPMPAQIVEKCVAGAHYGPELKAKARAHASHVILYYAGNELDPLEQYVALAVVAGVLAKHGAMLVLNESGHTSLPASVFTGEGVKGDLLGLLRSLPIPMLYSGFVKFDVEGVNGVWMRTFGNELLGLPDLAHLATGHDQGQSTFDMFCNLLNYLRSSKAALAPGHTMEIGKGTVLKIRAPGEREEFLESKGTMLVLEKISLAESNRR